MHLYVHRSASQERRLPRHGLSTMNPEGAADRETTYSSFHRRHGDNIALGNDGRTAWRKKGEYRKALVFSEGPMPVGNVFQLKLLSNHPMGDLVSSAHHKPLSKNRGIK